MVFFRDIRLLSVAPALFAAFILNQFEAKAQDAVTIENADILAYDEARLGKVKRWIGNVRFRQGNTFFTCDSAYQNESNNTIDAFGRVFIQESDSITLSGKRLNYDGKTRHAKMYGNVVLSDRQMTLYTEEINYELDPRIGYYPDSGMIVNLDNRLSSKHGTYYAASRDFFFKRDVMITNPKYTIKSDTLRYETISGIAWLFGPTTITGDGIELYAEWGWYDTRNDYARFSTHARLRDTDKILHADRLIYTGKMGKDTALGNVWLQDTTNKIDLYGQQGTYNRLHNRARITVNPLAAINVDGDTLFVVSDTMQSNYDSMTQKREVFLFRKVRFFKQNLQGVCDSLYYNSLDSVLKMFSGPVLWSDSNQLSADTVMIYFSNGEMDRLLMRSNSFIVSRKDALRFNQVKGRETIGHFSNGELYEVFIDGNGESIYFVEEDSLTLLGMNRVTCGSIRMYLQDREITEIIFYEQPEGALTPLYLLEEPDMRLPGFAWRRDLRPAGKEVLRK